MKKTEYENIYDLISKGNTSKAIETLLSYSKDREIIKIANRFKNLEKQNTKGLLLTEQYSVERNKIINELLSHLEEKKHNNSGNNEKKNWSQKRIKILFIGVLTLGIISLFLFTNNSKKEIFESNYYKILLFQFEPIINHEDCVEGQYCAAAIKKGIEDFSFKHNSEIEVAIYPETIRNVNFKIADSIGRESKANLIIWGDYELKRNAEPIGEVNIKYSSTDNLPWGIDSSGQTGFLPVEYYNELQEGKFSGSINDIIYFSIGHKLLSENKNEEAIQYFDKIENFKADTITNHGLDDVLAMFSLLTNPDSGIAMMNDEIARNKLTDRPMNFFAKGENYFRQGKYDLAIKNYSTALKIDSKYVIALLHRSHAYVKLKNYKKALSDLYQAEKIVPKIPQVNNTIGDILSKEGDFQGGIDNYLTSLQKSNVLPRKSRFIIGGVFVDTLESKKIKTTYERISRNYRYLNKIDSAYFYFQKSTELY